MKPDATLIDIVSGFFVLLLIFGLVEHVLGRRRGCPWVRRGWWTDVAYWFFSPLVTGMLTKFVLVAPVLVLLWFGVAKADDFRLGHYHGFGPVARQPVWWQTVEIYLLFDFIGYWMHRFFHRRRWWTFHAVHHSSEELDWLSGVRIHPINELVSKFCQITPFLWLGFDPLVTLSVAPFYMFHAIFVHAAVDWDFGPLRGIVVSPVFHRWHHSKNRAAWDKNFAGLFAFWDRLFGTYFMPRDRIPGNFGIPETFPQNFLGQLGRPLAQFIANRPVENSMPQSSTTQSPTRSGESPSCPAYVDESLVRVRETAIMIPIPSTTKHVIPTYAADTPAATKPHAIPPTSKASPTM